eukprot:UN14286
MFENENLQFLFDIKDIRLDVLESLKKHGKQTFMNWFYHPDIVKQQYKPLVDVLSERFTCDYGP